MNPNLVFFLFGGKGGGGARVRDFFSKNPNLKINNFFLFLDGVGG